MTTAAADPIPPHSLEHEMCCLGSMLIDPDAVAHCAARLTAEDFYRSDHKAIFATVVKMHAAGVPCDLVTVPEALRTAGQLESVGGVLYLAELAECVPTAANIEHYAEVVADHAARRRLITSATAIIRTAYKGRDDPDATLAKLKAQTIDAFRSLERGGDATPLSKSIRDRAAQLRLPKEQRPKPIPWRLPAMDRISGGLYPGEMMILASQPSIGKTAMILQAATQANLEEGTGVLYFSLEMPAWSMSDRVVSRLADGLSMNEFRNDMVRDDQLHKLDDVATRLDAAPFLVEYHTVSADAICSTAAVAIAKHGIRLVVVDILGQVHPPPESARDNEASRIGASLQRFQRLALDYGVAVCVVHHLNRDNVKAGRAPTLSDLNKSGDCERYARQVVALHVPDDKNRASVQFLVLKNNQGQCGVGFLNWNGAKQQYTDPDEPPPQTFTKLFPRPVRGKLVQMDDDPPARDEDVPF